MKNFIFIFLLVLLGQQNVSAQKTLKVWVVRHAEKLAIDPKDKDPELSDEGKLRAQALLKELKGEEIDSIFATNYKRTKLTGFPLADKIGISVRTYDPAKIKILAKEWMGNAKGKNLLIVGHSNTVLEIIEAFGGSKPVKELTDDDYDYLFELTIKGTKVDVKVARYGVEHHSKEDTANKSKM
jgi:2,3-bisphosphoglycerate-dependent phosphoglycerate mutase